MPVARTVLGDIPAEQLGISFCHEHITFSWGSAKRDLGELYDREAIAKRLSDSIGAAKRDHNVNTMVCVSTAEMGRDVDIYAEVSRRTGVNIIASTGSYRQNAGVSLYWNLQSLERFEDYMIKEITEGVGRDRIKCGNIKLGWASYAPTPAEEKFYRAGGRVSKKLNIPIALHCVYGGSPGDVTHAAQVVPQDVNPGVEMVKLLTSEGADPSKIKVDHAGSARGNIGKLLEVLRMGANISFEDLFKSVERDTTMTGMVGALIAAGYVGQIFLAPQAIAPGWIPTQPQHIKENWAQDHSYLHRMNIPQMVKNGISEKHIEQMLVDNPKRFLSF